MSTIAENLTALQNAKTAIAAAITEKGGTVGSGDGFADFAAAILGIRSGSGSTLPTLTSPASANDILSGREAISGGGSTLTGTLKIRCGTVTVSQNLTNMTLQKIDHDLGVTPKIIFARKVSTDKVASTVSWALYCAGMGGYSYGTTCYAVTKADLSQSIEISTGNRIAVSSNGSGFNFGMTDSTYFWKAGETVDWWVIG